MHTMHNDDIKTEQGLSRNAIARHLKITPGALSNVINGKSSVTAEMAIKLHKAFGMPPEMWLRLQDQFDLFQAEKSLKGEYIAPLAD